jgi:hypothetical protein
MEDITQVVLPKKRPTFLTVLCILTFIFSTLISGFYAYQYVTFDKTYPEKSAQTAELMENLEDAGQDSGFVYKSLENEMIRLEKTSENLEAISFANILFALLSFFGAFLMFKLKKTGFYIYTGSNLFWMLVPIALIGMEAGMMNIAFGIGFTILFIILYGVNLKHME